MAASDIIISGLYFQAGKRVTAFIGGLDCGDYVVSSAGSITVPLLSDPDQLLSSTYLQLIDVGPYDQTTYGAATTQISFGAFGGAATVYVPVVVGFCYQSAGQLLRPDSQDDTKSAQGPGLGKTRRVHTFAALMQSSVGTFFGTNINNLRPAKFNYASETPLPKNILFSGVYADAADDSNSYDGMLAWSVVRPYPCTVVSLSGFIETQER